MVSFLAKRLLVGFVALVVGVSASFFYWAAKFPPPGGGSLVDDYWIWLKGLITGRSFTQMVVPPGELFREPLLGPIATAFGHTVALIGLTFVFVVVITIAIACVTAATHGSLLDASLRTGMYIAWAVPGFVLAGLLQDWLGNAPFGSRLGWFPAGGWAGECPNGLGLDPHNFHCPAAGHGLTHVGLVLYHLTLPAIALAAGFIGLHARHLRSALLEILGAPYITVARAKGLPERTVFLRHGLRNAIVSFLPVLLGDFGALFGAAFVIDYIFQLGGLGTVFVEEMRFGSDFPPAIDTYKMQLILIFTGVLMLAASLLGETLAVVLDPRARPR